MKTVLTDASSAILLYKSDLFDTLLDHWRIVMAPAVYKEVTVQGYPGAELFTIRHDTGRFQVVDTLLPPGQPGTPWIAEIGSNPVPGPAPWAAGAGELETIALFTPALNGFILMDDAKGARECLKRHIPYINALLVPKLLWYSDVVTQSRCARLMELLCTIGRYSKHVRTWAFQCTRQELHDFLDLNAEEHNHDRHC